MKLSKKSMVAGAVLLAAAGIAAPVGITSAHAADAAVVKQGQTSPKVTAVQLLLQAHGAKLAAAECAGCHGAKGMSTTDTVPGLAGQIPNYLQLQLAAFRAKLRPSEVMQPIAGKLSDQDIADLTAYYTAQNPGPAWKADAAARQRGQKLYTAGDPARNVMACTVCHGSEGRGLNANHIASITNLSPKYAVKILKEFHDAPSFGGLVPPETMRIAVHPLNDGDLNDLAAYISSMK